ncbi:hypothetical protein C8Q80DRAFT_1183379 [Daedaleopsis nitida]|nr:hypothetical protein C8Q80DRAFT_1183379 [Daedaleopsis nitida]
MSRRVRYSGFGFGVQVVRPIPASSIGNPLPTMPGQGTYAVENSLDSVMNRESSERIAPPPSASLGEHTQAALERSLTSGVFIDACFLLFSERKHDGTRIGAQAPIYSHSQTLYQASDYFQSLLSGGFAESRIPSRSQQTAQQDIPIDEYGYALDSDLEDEEEEVPDKEPITEAQIKTMSEHTAEKHSTMIAGEPSIEDMQLEHPSLIVTVPLRHFVVIKDSAFRTFKALVYYIYTGDINFSTLRSLKVKKSTTPLSCSPKSMYRLADKYGMADLKKLALDNLKSQLTTDIILVELFSQFTSRYPDVIEIETDYVRAHRKDLACLQDLQQWMDMAVRGDIPHASAALVSLLRKLAAQ